MSNMCAHTCIIKLLPEPAIVRQAYPNPNPNPNPVPKLNSNPN